MSEQVRVTLGEALEILIDHRGKTPTKLGGDWSDSGIRVVSAINIKDRRIDQDNVRYVPEDIFERWMPVKLKRGDVLLTSEAPLGEVARVRDDEPICLGQRLFGLRGKPGLLDGGYLYYLLGWGEPRDEILGRATGTTVGGIRQSELVRVQLKLPPVAEQRAIAGVLGALDDKIESNRRIWRLRQEIAVAYFNLCSSRSEVEIPMNDLYRVGLSGVWGEESPTDSSTIETTCLRGRDLEDYMTGSRCAPPARFITNRQLQARNPELGEIWTAGSGSLGPSLLITESVKKLWGAPITNSNFVKRLVPIGQHIHHAPAFHVVWESWKSGGFSNFRTGTAMPNLDPDALLRGLSVPQLTIEEIAALTDLTEVALDSQLPKETVALSSLRDALLPELLSGRLPVRDAEKAVEGAL